MRYFEQIYEDYNFDSSNSELSDADLRQDNSQYLAEILKNYPPKSSNCDGGLYTGTLGVAYLLYKLANREKNG